MTRSSDWTWEFRPPATSAFEGLDASTQERIVSEINSKWMCEKTTLVCCLYQLFIISVCFGVDSNATTRISDTR